MNLVVSIVLRCRVYPISGVERCSSLLHYYKNMKKLNKGVTSSTRRHQAILYYPKRERHSLFRALVQEADSGGLL